MPDALEGHLVVKAAIRCCLTLATVSSARSPQTASHNSRRIVSAPADPAAAERWDGVKEASLERQQSGGRRLLSRFKATKLRRRRPMAGD